MGKKTKTPPAPNYAALAQQDAASRQAAWQAQTAANRPNQVGPDMSTNWTQDAAGNWTQNTSLSPDAQRRQAEYDATQSGVLGAAGGAGSRYESQAGPSNQYNPSAINPVSADYSGVQAMPEVGGYNQQVIDTIRSLQAPDLERQRAAKEAQLAAMGVGTGTGTAWNTEQETLGKTENNAQLQAILAGINQGNIEFGQGMDINRQGMENAGQRYQTGQDEQRFRYDIEQGDKAFDWNREQADRDRAYQEYSGLLGLGQQGYRAPMQNPNVPYAGSYGGTDATGAAQNQYSAALDKTNARNADRSNLWSTVGTVGSIAAIAF